MIYPSFKAYYGRDPELGRDFAPDKYFCQDDYEYYTGTGQYHDDACLIYSVKESEFNNEPMFWSNQQGWVSYPDADVFLSSEVGMPNPDGRLMPLREAISTFNLYLQSTGRSF